MRTRFLFFFLTCLTAVAALQAAPAGASASRFTYEVCDSALPGGNTPGVQFVANGGVPYTGFNDCAGSNGAIGIRITGNVQNGQISFWSIPIAATPRGFVEGLTLSGSACGLGPLNSHSFIYDQPWPGSSCLDLLRQIHIRDTYNPYTSGGGFSILMNCEGNAAGQNCGPGPTIAGHYFAATEVDPNPPVVAGVAGGLLRGGTLRGHQDLMASATDKGGGVSKLAVAVNGVTAGAPLTPTCGAKHVSNPSIYGTVAWSTTPCPASIGGAEWSLDTQAYPFRDGQNRVEVCASDFATIGEPNESCWGPQTVEVDNSCTPSSIDGGEVLSAQFAHSNRETETVGFGREARIAGKLSNNAGDAISGATLCVKARTIGVDGSAATVAAIKTDAEGLYRYNVHPGPNRELTIGYRHDSRQVAREVRYYAHAGPTLHLDPARLRNGGSVKLWGRLPGPRANRRVVVIQANVAGSKRWITFRKATSDGRGRFSSSYQFNSTTRKTRYRFRALVPRQAGYPWLEGHSKPATVSVRP